MELPGLQSFDRSTRQGMEDLNNRIDQDLEAKVMEAVRRQANMLLDSEGVTEEDRAASRL